MSETLSRNDVDEKGQDLSSNKESPVVPDSRSVEEKRLVRKLDKRILPITCLLYLFACQSPYIMCLNWYWFVVIDLDRTNLGNARLQGLPRDTLGGDPNGHLFDWVTSAFFFSYVSTFKITLENVWTMGTL